MSIVHDISDRQTAEQALRESEAKFAAIFSLTPDPVALTRLSDGVVLEASRSYSEYFGYRPEEVVGRSTLPGALNPWIDAEQRRHWTEVIMRDGEVIGFEMPLRRQDGAIVTAVTSGKLLEIGGEQCVIVAIHDITEQIGRASCRERG